MIVGFNSSEYNANEDDGTLEITVEPIPGVMLNLNSTKVVIMNDDC